MLRPYKFLIVPVLQQLDQDGNVTGELQTEHPDTAFGVAGLLAYANGFEEALTRQGRQMMNGTMLETVEPAEPDTTPAEPAEPEPDDSGDDDDSE
jgi:hypothetical protein